MPAWMAAAPPELMATINLLLPPELEDELELDEDVLLVEELDEDVLDEVLLEDELDDMDSLVLPPQADNAKVTPSR